LPPKDIEPPLSIPAVSVVFIVKLLNSYNVKGVLSTSLISNLFTTVDVVPIPTLPVNVSQNDLL